MPLNACQNPCLTRHQIAKLLEKVPAIVRSRRSFGVILNTKRRVLQMANSSDGIVIEIAMRDFQIPGKRRLIHGETMVLGRYLDAAVLHIEHGLIGSAMPKLQLESLGAGSKTQ